MKKTFLPLTALAMLALVACGNPNNSSAAPASSPTPTTSSVTPITYGVTINNKTALTEEWHKGEADRKMNISVTPAGNVAALVNSGELTIVSSNAEVVFVAGTMLRAAGEGTATVTVTYHEKTDTVEIEVGAALVEADYEKKTLTEVMAIEEGLVTSGSNKYYNTAFITKVKVAVIGNKKDGSGSKDAYGNLYVTDPNVENDTNLVQVYGSGASFAALTYDFSIQAYKYVNAKNFMDNKDTNAIKVGDVLDVVAIRADYNTTKEISMVIRAINGKLISNDNSTTDKVNATEDSPNVRKQLVTVSGKITGWKDAKTTGGTKYGNFYIQSDDSKTDPVYVYGATASTQKAVEGGDPVDVIQLTADGSLKFNNPQDWETNAVTKDLKIGDKVTVTGFRCDYKGQIELNGIVSKYVEPAPEPDPVAATVDDLVAKTASEKDKLYKISGIWEAPKGDDFGGGYLTNPETGKSILVYGSTKTATAFTYDGTSGSPVFTWTNPKDAKTSLADLVPGKKIEVLAMNAYFARESLPEINCVVTKIEDSSATYSASAETAENGTVQLSKSTGLAYGEEVTVTATPDDGYALRKLEVVDAHGGKTDITETLKFKATCVNKVVATFASSDTTVSVGKFSFATPEFGNQPTKMTDEQAATVKGWFTAGAGATVAVSSVSTFTNVYGGANGGSGDNTWKTNNVLKLGSSSAAGKITITLNSAVSKVVINGYGWKNTITVKVNSVESTGFRTNLANKANVAAKKMDSDAFFLATPATDIVIETVGTALVIDSIEFFAEPAA